MIKPLTRNLIAPIGALALGFSSSALAQGTASEKASAEKLFDDGVALVAAGNYSEGCARFEASQTLEPTLGTELHLADCYERAGKTASAWALFKESEALAHRQGQPEREELSHVRAAALTDKLSYLVIETTEAPPAGFSVERNGHAVPVASLGVPVPVDPGTQTVTASAPARRPWSSEIEVRSVPGTTHLLIPRLAPVAVRHPAAPPVSVRGDTGNTQRAIGISAVAVGGAGILAGLGLGLYAKHENDQSRLDRYCPTDSHNGCTDAGVDLRQRAEHFASASTVTFVASGAVLAAGLLLWSTTPTPIEQHALTRLKLSATGSPSSFQTVLRGDW